VTAIGLIEGGEMTEDEKDFEECCKKFGIYPHQKFTFDSLRVMFKEGRRMLREKIKPDPSIGKLEIAK
jgi:hypothetical protein